MSSSCRSSCSVLVRTTKGPRTGPPPFFEVVALQRLDVRSRGTLRPLLGVVAHARALGQRLEAVALDRAVVHEQILTRIIRGNKAEALVVAEPLHGSCCHLFSLRGRVHSETRRVLERNNCGNAWHYFWSNGVRPLIQRV